MGGCERVKKHGDPFSIPGRPHPPLLFTSFSPRTHSKEKDGRYPPLTCEQELPSTSPIAELQEATA